MANSWHDKNEVDQELRKLPISLSAVTYSVKGTGNRKVQNSE